MRKDGGAANDLVDAVHATAIFRERNPTDSFWREAVIAGTPTPTNLVIASSN